MIRVDALTKRFGSLTAVNGVSLEIRDGEIFGLLGPNGAGKTTLINMLCGLLAPSAGDISVGGLDIKNDLFAIKRMIGVVPQELAIYEDLTARENVAFFAGLYGLRGAALKEAVRESLEFAGLSEAGAKLPKTFSGGMKRRLNVACGIAHRPRLIVMDEPTVGIDPQSRRHILDSVKKLNAQGRTVLYTTHYMEEAEYLCSRSAIIDHGKIIAQGGTEELQALVKDSSRYVVSMRGERSLDCSGLEAIPGVLGARVEGAKILIDNEKDVDNFGRIAAWLAERSVPVAAIELDAPNLEAVFLALTGRKLRD